MFKKHRHLQQALHASEVERWNKSCICSKPLSARGIFLYSQSRCACPRQKRAPAVSWTPRTCRRTRMMRRGGRQQTTEMVEDLFTKRDLLGSTWTCSFFLFCSFWFCFDSGAGLSYHCYHTADEEGKASIVTSFSCLTCLTFPNHVLYEICK